MCLPLPLCECVCVQEGYTDRAQEINVYVREVILDVCPSRCIHVCEFTQMLPDIPQTHQMLSLFDLV